MRTAWGIYLAVAYVALAFGIALLSAWFVLHDSAGYGALGGALVGFGAAALGLHHANREVQT